MSHPLFVLVLVAASHTAFAKTTYRREARAPVEENNAFAFGHATKLSIERADLSITTDDTGARGSLRIVLATWDERTEDRSILFAVPDGIEIDKLTLDLAGQRLVGTVTDARTARAEYEQTVRTLKDPALLEWVSSSTQTTSLRLRVFPITAGTPATIELGFTLPRGASIAIDPGAFRIGHASIYVDGHARSTDQLHERLELAFPAIDPVSAIANRPSTRSFVNRKRSLVATPDPDDRAFDGRPEPRVALVRDPLTNGIY